MTQKTLPPAYKTCVHLDVHVQEKAPAENEFAFNVCIIVRLPVTKNSFIMRNILFIVTVIVFFLTGCTQGNRQLKDRIQNSDSAAINYFNGDGSMDTVVAVKIIRDKKILEQLSNYISAAVTQEKPGCGYDGSIHFFSNNIVIQDIYFRMQNDCSQFSFSFNRVRGASQLSADAR